MCSGPICKKCGHQSAAATPPQISDLQNPDFVQIVLLKYSELNWKILEATNCREPYPLTAHWTCIEPSWERSCGSHLRPRKVWMLRRAAICGSCQWHQEVQRLLDHGISGDRKFSDQNWSTHPAGIWSERQPMPLLRSSTIDIQILKLFMATAFANFCSDMGACCQNCRPVVPVADAPRVVDCRFDTGVHVYFRYLPMDLEWGAEVDTQRLLVLLLFCGHVLIIAQIFMDPPDLRILLMGIEFDLDIGFLMSMSFSTSIGFRRPKLWVRPTPGSLALNGNQCI